MVREVKLLSYIPDFLKEYREMKVLQQVMEPEIQEMEDETELLFGNQFISTAEERGLRLYEKMLGMQVFADDTLEDRSFKVLSMWSRMIPYTRTALRKRLNILCGEDGYSLIIDPGKVLIVRVALKSKSCFDEVKKVLEEFVPCNMVIDLQLLYNQHEMLKQFTHRQLGAWSHRQIRNEVLDYE